MEHKQNFSRKTGKDRYRNYDPEKANRLSRRSHAKSYISTANSYELDEIQLLVNQRRREL